MWPTPRDAAISHAERGWVLVPLIPGTGRPCRKWKNLCSTPPEAVAAWWPGPLYNPGILAERSRLVLVNLDGPEHGTEVPQEWQRLGVEHGRDVLAVLADRAGQEIPATYTVGTYRDGEHLYFLPPADRVIRNSASRVGPMIDVRGRGGLIVGAGSVRGGRRYEVLDDRDPVPLPAWLAALADPPRPCSSPRASACCSSPAHPDRYAAAALRGEVDRVLDAPRGRRNHQLNASAFSLGRLVGGGVLERAKVTSALLAAAEANGLAAEDGTDSCMRTVTSGVAAGIAQPRGRAA